MNLKNLQKELEQAIGQYKVAGASIAVFYKDVLTTAAAGVTNVTTNVRMTSDTVMHINSITKVFNATLIMQLVDKGLVELDAPILRYLPNFKVKDQDALQRITVGMLIDHTSGIDGDLLPDYGHDQETLEKAVIRFSELGQIHAPGEECSYCNIATVIAGYLAQQLTGKNWHDLIKENIYAPLDLSDAVTLPEDALLHRASIGHYLNPTSHELERVSTAFLPLSFAPAGATLMMSARDLVTFSRTHMVNGLAPNGHRLLSKKSAKAMRKITSPKIHFGGVIGFGLGWEVFNNGVQAHAGAGAGTVSMLYIHPEKEFAAAILVNTAHGLELINHFTKPWLKEVANIRPYRDAEISPSRVNIKSFDSERYVGTYENISMRYEISAQADGIALQAQGKFRLGDMLSVEKIPIISLIYLGDNNFAYEQSAEIAAISLLAPIEVRFTNPDAAGRPQNLFTSKRLFQRVQ